MLYGVLGVALNYAGVDVVEHTGTFLFIIAIVVAIDATGTAGV